MCHETCVFWQGVKDQIKMLSRIIKTFGGLNPGFTNKAKACIDKMGWEAIDQALNEFPCWKVIKCICMIPVEFCNYLTDILKGNTKKRGVTFIVNIGELVNRLFGGTAGKVVFGVGNWVGQYVWVIGIGWLNKDHGKRQDAFDKIESQGPADAPPRPRIRLNSFKDERENDCVKLVLPAKYHKGLDNTTVVKEVKT